MTPAPAAHPARVLLTGAGGFIGAIVARRLLETRPGIALTLTDCRSHPRIEALADRAAFVAADLTDPAAARRLVDDSVDLVYHFAGMVSGGAEQHFDLGMRVNVHAMLHLLEACRAAGHCPRFVFPSTIASFGGHDMPDTVDDWTFQHPQSSYGAAKVIGEQLLNDYSRRGYIDGRGVRLAATIVRDDPHAGLSCSTSAMIREPVAGRDHVCKLPPEACIPLLGAPRAADMFVRLGEIDGAALGDYRTLNGPAFSTTVQDIADAVRGCGRAGVGRITFDVDPDVARIVGTWPKAIRYARAAALGFDADSGIEEVVDAYARP
jgi:nucleoside-diphosphate-sugar epimerase